VGEVDAREVIAVGVECGAIGPVAEAQQLVGHASWTKEFERAGLHAERAGGGRRFGRLVDDADVDAKSGQFEGGGQSGGSCADDQD
jgi:hypothetical protein